MKRLLLDIKIVLDVLLDRQPHATASAAVWSLIETRAEEGLLAAHAFTTLYYLVRKDASAPKARRIMSSLLAIFEVAAVDATVIRDATELTGSDFEDCVTAAAAWRAKCDYIVTRDPRGFHGSRVQALTPGAVLALIAAK